MVRRICFLILIALGLVAVPGTYMMSGLLIRVLLDLTDVWVIHPAMLPMLMMVVPFFIAMLVVVGSIVSWNRRSVAALAVLSVPALMGLLTIAGGLFTITR